jgi:uncharacterized membrane protein YkvA (DUF1232 family)
VSLAASLLLALAVVVALYAALVAALVAAGRREHARAFARLVPDCVVLFRRLLADPRVPAPRKALLVVAIAYLVMPFDLVPDFIPVAGQLDDAIIVALVLRGLLRGSGDLLVCEHWPGPRRTLMLVRRLATAP